MTAYDLGLLAEDIISKEYIKKGYAILERNWRMGKTEIDIISQIGNIIVFTEVKARKGDYTEPLDSITLDKKKRMIRAADCYLRNLKGEYEYRFDFAAFTGDKSNYVTEILEDAFLAAEIF